MSSDRGDSWIFRRPDGHAYALSDVRPGVTTEEQAWRSMYARKTDIRERQAAGITVTRKAWAEYSEQGVYECLAWKCQHAQSEVAA